MKNTWKWSVLVVVTIIASAVMVNSILSFKSITSEVTESLVKLISQTQKQIKVSNKAEVGTFNFNTNGYTPKQFSTVKLDDNIVRTSDWITYQYDINSHNKVEFKIPPFYSYNGGNRVIRDNKVLLYNGDAFTFSRPFPQPKKESDAPNSSSFSVKFWKNPKKLTLDEWVNIVYVSLEEPNGIGQLIYDGNKRALYAFNSSFCADESVFYSINDTAIVEFNNRCSGSSIDANESLRVSGVFAGVLDSFKLVKD